MEPDKNNRNQNGPGGNNQRQTWMVISICLVISLMLFNYFGGATQRSASKEISYNAFLEMVRKDQVEKVLLEEEKIIITPKEKTGETESKSSRARKSATIFLLLLIISNTSVIKQISVIIVY